MKKIPHWSLLRAFRLSKIESTIKHLPSRAHLKSTRSYHNSVPRHHPIENSLAASPHWVTLFRVLYNVSSLDPINIKSFYLPQVFPICSDILGITAMIPFPWVSFICCLVCPAVILWTKEFWVSHSLPTPVQFFPFPPLPPNSVSQSADYFTPFGYPSRSWSRNHHCLD